MKNNMDVRILSMCGNLEYCLKHVINEWITPRNAEIRKLFRLNDKKDDTRMSFLKKL